MWSVLCISFDKNYREAFLYTYMAYEFGDHSVLAAPLREDGGCIQVKIGGYKLENTPALQEILKSLKVKKTE